MTKKNSNEISIAPKINVLEVGQSVSFPMEKNTIVRSTVSNRSIGWGKTFTCSLDKEQGIITVTRTT